MAKVKKKVFKTGKNPNHPGGSGRGMKGVMRVDDPDRPDACARCGGFMKSKGASWACTNSECGHMPRKVTLDSSIKKYNETIGFDPDTAEAHARQCEKPKRLILTSAQNNSEVFDKALRSLRQAKKYFGDCEIGIIPSHYRNTTLYSKGDKKEFDDLLKPYLVKSTIQFGNVEIKSDVRVQPTTVNPLSGKHSHGGKDWIVLGHPQLTRESVATSGDTFPKLMMTTGSITRPNYSVSDAGEKGKFHHCQSAILLEKYKDFVFVRQLSFDDNGHFYDLDVKFTPSGYSFNHRIDALTTGDEHVKWNIVEKETYGKGGIVEKYRPKFIVRHDVLDGYAGSHHHEKQPMVQFVKHHNGDNDYRVEIEQAIAFINRTTPSYAETLIVPSNHHDHLSQYLNRVDANVDHQNAIFIAEMQGAMRVAALKKENFDPFYLYAKDRLTCKFKFLDRNIAYYINDISHDQHGDVGTNGSRGSGKGLAKSPDKMTVGHSHCVTEGHMANVRFRGFTPIKEVVVGDEVLGFENGANVWTKVLSTPSSLYTGKLLTIGSKATGSPFRQTVTDNHRLFLKDGSYIPVDEAVAFRDAEEIPITAKPVEQSTTGSTVSVTTLQRVIATCADGSFDTGDTLRFNFIKDRKKRRLEYLFGDSIKGWGVEDHRGAQKTSITKNSEAWCDVTKHVGKGRKSLPTWLLDLDTEMTKIAVDELTRWDGYINGKIRQFASSKPEEITIVASMVNSLGYRCSFKYPHLRNTGQVWWSIDRSTGYVITPSHDKERLASWQVQTKEVVDEPVFCLETINNNFWIRENVSGNISLTGNSALIFQGLFQVATSTGRLEYERGLSSHSNTHCLQYKDGKRTLIDLRYGRHCAIQPRREKAA